MVAVIAPNFVSVRLQDDDRQNYAKIHEATERAVGKRLSTADIYRHAMRALAEKHNVKGIR